MQRWRQLRSIKRRPVTNKYGLDDKRFLRIARFVLAFVTPRRRCVSFNRRSFLREITILISRWTLDESTGRVRVAHRQDVGSYFKRTHFLRTATHETDWFHTSSFFLRAAASCSGTPLNISRSFHDYEQMCCKFQRVILLSLPKFFPSNLSRK